MIKTLLVSGSAHIKTRVATSIDPNQIDLDWTFSIDRAYQLLENHTYHLVIVEKELADGDGFELIDYLHTSFYNTYVLALLASNLKSAELELLQSGADGCLSINCDPLELKLKLQKYFHSYKLHQPNILKLNDMTLYSQQGIVKSDSRSLQLRKKEFQIFEYLCLNKNLVISREQIIQAIWPHQELNTSTIDSYIKRIRHILGPKSECLKTIWGYGYMLKEQ